MFFALIIFYGVYFIQMFDIWLVCMFDIWETFDVIDQFVLFVVRIEALAKGHKNLLIKGV